LGLNCLDKKYIPVIAAFLIAAFFLINVAADIIIYYQRKTVINIFWAALFTGFAVPFIIFLLYVLEGYLYKRKIKESIKTSQKNQKEKIATNKN
jgi:hypothetical protein